MNVNVFMCQKWKDHVGICRTIQSRDDQKNCIQVPQESQFPELRICAHWVSSKELIPPGVVPVPPGVEVWVSVIFHGGWGRRASPAVETSGISELEEKNWLVRGGMSLS